MSGRAPCAVAVIGAVAVALMGGPLGAGCGVAGDPAQPDGGNDASSNCPATLRQAYGASCVDEGHVCPIMVDCAVTFELVQCKCSASRWRCSDAVGALEAGVAPHCVEPAAPSKEPCPSSLRAGQGMACDDFGRQCFYEGEDCDSGITLLDYCSCARHPDGGALAYDCLRLVCSPPIEVDR